jgi:hypothetical protein
MTAISVSDTSLVVISEEALEEIRTSIKKEGYKEFIAQMFPKSSEDEVFGFLSIEGIDACIL